MVPLQASSNAERIISNGEAVNVKLTDQDVAEIDKLLASIELAGGRTHAVGEAMAVSLPRVGRGGKTDEGLDEVGGTVIVK